MDMLANQLLADELEYSHWTEDESTGTSNSQLDSPTVQCCSYSTDDLIKTQPDSSASKGKAGRKVTPATEILSALKTKNEKPWKKEYVRCQLIRGEKKLARQFKENRFTRKSLSQFELNTPDDAYYWGQLKALYEQNPQLFDAMSPTSSGPATDGIRKRTGEAEQKSFNDEFCRQHYSSQEAREFHYYYVLLTYGKEVTDPRVLCRKFASKCCSTGCHTERCVVAWERVREYVLIDMVKDLGLPAFTEGYRYEEPRDVEMIEDLEDPYALLNEAFR